jgi:integrase
MPRKREQPRLYLRKRPGRSPIWVILGLGPEKSTGCGEGDVEGAQREFARLIAEKYEPPKTGGDLKRTSVSDVVNVYLRERAPKTAAPKKVAYLAGGILEWWGDKVLADIRAKTCDDYVAWRTAQKRKRRRGGLVSDQTARHELNLLSTAISYYHANYGPLTAIPVVTMPPMKGARVDYYLTRKEVAERIRAARRLRKCKHVIRALLIGIYTGTRPGAAQRLHWIPSTNGGWFDLDSGILHRRAEGEIESNKRQTPCRIHNRLLPWLRRWYRQDMIEGVRRRKQEGASRVYERVQVPYVIHYAGRPIEKLRRSWLQVAATAGQAERIGTDANGKPIWKALDGPHIMRHTAATWQMQSGTKLTDAADYLGMDPKTLWNVYGHHHPDFHAEAAQADGRRKTAFHGQFHGRNSGTQSGKA